ncbi:nucleoside triphosphate pyrophosphohydrolase ham1 [Neophaeococcomyces mojaviensis]|uniref:Nucleoside triphosphate pyrophosphohydrolase ham1 n=1 Tax=Neophaeococcomyces mojaviensis TaxID=3383035 RepID=A0ACC2ZXY3_9EURO|nr:nucleoside triphosphate pyrophosphohydrolase ham1 [Knufia sp. JES_112]
MSKSATSRPTHLIFLTSNAGKLREFQAGMSNVPNITVTNRADVDIDEIQGTIEEIAIDKCRRAAEIIGGPVLTEDTALEFRALGGLPGPYIKYFLMAIGHEGLNNLLAAYEDKTIYAVCTFAYCAGPGSQPILFQGRTEGKLVPARGPSAFGWDPCFEYPPAGQTYAEMDKEEKNKISHRGKAQEKLKRWLAGEEIDAL